jgi:prepilin-type N-terminal cleavage/methylation domain-containing protein/prepilin-type processing-associated H-X9-DG protein
METGRYSDIRKSGNGFTLVELLAVLAVIALLAMTLLPAIASRPDAKAFQCQNNQKQLILAWQMYAEDNRDVLPPNDYPFTTAYFSQPGGTQAHMRNWAVGTMEQPLDSRTWQELVPTGVNLHLNTCLAGYITNAQLYRCPADQYIDPFSHALHVRSYSMNSAVGTVWWSSFQGGPPLGSPVQGGWLPGTSYNQNQTTWLTYGKITSFTKAGPANIFVFMDENPYSINDGTIAIPAEAAPGATYLADYPAGNHDGAGSISFADGHVVMHKWLDWRTFNPAGLIQPGQGGAGGLQTHQTPDNPDCFYLGPITSALR